MALKPKLSSLSSIHHYVNVLSHMRCHSAPDGVQQLPRVPRELHREGQAPEVAVAARQDQARLPLAGRDRQVMRQCDPPEGPTYKSQGAGVRMVTFSWMADLNVWRT